MAPNQEIVPASGDSRHRLTPAKTPRWALISIATLTATVLVLTVETQLFDTNFYSLWEATSLLLGDHPYRDFYEWGVPLQAAVSAAAQWLVGYRLIGEFLVQWTGIVAGAVVSFHLGYQLSRSLGASFATAAIALVLLAATPTFHYPKLFFYPVGVWLAWRYIERPAANRGVALGLLTATAFLYRHDHGVYLAGASGLAFVLAHLSWRELAASRPVASHAAACAATAVLIVGPWLAFVQASEGIPDYFRRRAELYEMWSPNGLPFGALLRINPVRLLLGEPLPPPAPAIVSFEWDDVSDEQRAALEQRHGLRLRRAGTDGGRWEYEVANTYDLELLDLKSHLVNDQGFDWERLGASQSALPTRAAAQNWLAQVSMLVPPFLVISAAMSWRLARAPGAPLPMTVSRMLFAAVLLGVIESRLFRETSYVTAVAPLVAALAAPFLTWGPSLAVRARWAVAAALLVVTAIAAVPFAIPSRIFDAEFLTESPPRAMARLLASPPILGIVPDEQLRRVTRDAWLDGTVERFHITLRYLHDCTTPGDRILVTGSTPYSVGYYTERSIAGGHLFWHHRWRTQPADEQRALELLRHQAVPFAISTADPVLDDLQPYPRIREHVSNHYQPLEGSGGTLLIDTRRQPTGRFAPLGFPCFS